MTRGKFITLEGGEGTGKSTQALLLVAGLRAAGIDVVATREPGGAPGAEHIRRLLVDGALERWDPLTEVLLHYAARRDHVVKTIAPALAAGRWVVSDRFADSTHAYQGFGLGVPREEIATLDRMVLEGLKPDLTIIFDLPAEEGLRRAGLRAEPHPHRYERMDLAFHRRLRDGFLEIARAEPGRCVVVDASAPEEEVARRVRAAVRERLGTELR